MEPLATLLTMLAGKLAEKAFSEILGEVSTEIRHAIKGDPQKRAALQNVFQAGFEAALKEMNAPDSQRLERYAGALEFWLQTPTVATELTKLLNADALLRDPARLLDLACLEDEFAKSHEVDANPQAFAGLNLHAVLVAFANTYTRALEKQADKFPWLAMQLHKESVERQPPRPRSDTLRDDYLNWLVEVCDLLPLPILAARQARDKAKREASLNEVYVPLDVLDTPRAERMPKDGSRLTPEDLEQVAKEKRVPALRVLAQSQNCLAILLGDPGSGKTTLTNYLALCLAKEELEPGKGWLKRIPDWEPGRMLPVRIELRQLAARVVNAHERQGYAGMLWAFLEEEAARHYRGFFPEMEKELREKGGLLILDGFDEVTEAEGRRDRVREAIVDFLLTMKKCRVIITCRTYAYASIALADFVGYPLLPFSPAQIHQFIDGWYTIVGPRELLTPEMIAYRSASLKEAVDSQRNPHIAELAARPLLLTLMTMVYTSAGQLPRDRADLYRRCVQLLLDAWQRRIEERDAEGKLVTDGGILESLKISEEDLRNALYRAAYQAHERQGGSGQRARRTADITKDELRKAFALDDETKFETALKYIENRAGLIYGRGGEMYSFPHRSFQEYLAANHLGTLPKKQTRDLIRQDAEWWREVFLLQVGLRREQLEDARALIEYVCSTEYESNDKYEPADWQSAILAGQALVELRMRERIEEKKRHHEDATPFEDLVKQVLKWLVALTDTPALTPRERAQAGLTLGALGDPRNFYELCRVPAGEFMLGDDKSGEKDEKPAHPVQVHEFWIAKYPNTCAQYQKFIDANGYENSAYWKTKAAKEWLAKEKPVAPRYWNDSRWNQPNLPVVGVTWFEANAYCEWLTTEFSTLDLRFSMDDPIDHDLKSEITKRKLKIRLPTEAEWEKAATWNTPQKQKYIYSWEGDFDAVKANTGEGENPVGSTSSVGIYPNGASPCGARDMTGNVWEWCSTLYQEYPYRLDDKHESPEVQGSRVLRGGSWYDIYHFARDGYRGSSSPDNRGLSIGFRVVVGSSSY